MTRAWRVVRYGSPSEALELADVELAPPGPGELLVRSHATVLNYNEVDGCRGRYLTINPAVPYTLGMEVVGTVEAAGPGAERWLGQRVTSTAVGGFGAHAEQVLVSADMTFAPPAGWSDVEAACFFFPFHLAWLGLHERGRMAAGETVLVHAAAGGVGSAAVQLAVAAGATVIAVAGGAAKAALCRELGATHAIDHHEQDWAKVVDDLTDGRGVDIVFDGVGGPVVEPSFRCLARNGRHLIIGFASGIEAEEVPMAVPRTLCFGNLSVLGVLLSYNSDAAAARRHTGWNLTPRSIGEDINETLCAMAAAGTIRPVLGRTVAFADLPAALDEMEQRRTTGRVVVSVSAG
jgi:NADPH:quinone reductase